MQYATKNQNYTFVFFWSKHKRRKKRVEEVSIKWMDIQSVKEIDRGGVYEMDRKKKCQKLEISLKGITL